MNSTKATHHACLRKIRSMELTDTLLMGKTDSKQHHVCVLRSIEFDEVAADAEGTYRRRR